MDRTLKINRMSIDILREAGYEESLYGISLSRKQEVENMHNVAKRLAGKRNGHDKFLESICVWLDINAPRYWWQQFDTYRVGTSKQSESTMYTIKKEYLNEENFQGTIDKRVLEIINEYIRKGSLDAIKIMLPEGFLQRRIVCTNYKVLQNIIIQRSKHKLLEWRFFIEETLLQLKHAELLQENKGD